jgi:hypothetical protein
MNSPKGSDWPAISVRQPWAELLLSGRKTIEVRSWATDYRGRFWLHAGLKTDMALARSFGLNRLFRGGFVGSLDLVALLPLTPDRWRGWQHHHLDSSPFKAGMFAWLVNAPLRLLTPIPAKGQLGLFQLSDVVRHELQEAHRTVSQSRGETAG